MENLAVVIINCFAIVGFTFLAWQFDHWWIILFAILFMFEKKENK